MQIPETPDRFVDLDLFKQLDAYAHGTSTYLNNDSLLGREAKEACKNLCSSLSQLNNVIEPLLNRINAKEMDLFTMHDAKHARKVAHLMWHLLTPERRQKLTPPEIGLMLGAAIIHDLGMFLSPEEREARLQPNSDLWDILEIDETIRDRLSKLRKRIQNETNSATRHSLERQLFQAEEAMLCRDTRERHATPSRYREIISNLRQKHLAEPSKIPDPDACLSFGGDTFLDKLIDICVSHNESEDLLLARDESQPELPRLRRDYVVGSSSADLLLVASVLRIADILDFDRERTPMVLYNFFLPGSIELERSRSKLEWEKHLAISNWHIEREAIVFRGRCKHHLVHHAIVTFCNEIANTIAATKATCAVAETEFWPFVVPSIVKADIHAEGYRYLPYKFELDDERIYQLLLGGAIYENALDAVRELVQNACDACKLRDALTQLTTKEITPNLQDRIVVEYHEATSERPHPVLAVQDTGTGMDEYAISRWFLKVGSSFYSSAEFNKYRAQLRKEGLDFAPVSEFGIGFLSSFLLGDEIRVETAMWEPIRGDTKHRTLEIHGPSRLIRLTEHSSVGISRFRGTRVEIQLLRGKPATPHSPPTFEDILKYLQWVCYRLPYSIRLVRHSQSSKDVIYIEPRPLTVEMPSEFAEHAFRIAVNEDHAGLRGEIVLIGPRQAREIEKELAKETAIIHGNSDRRPKSALIRGGFRIGGVPGLPTSYLSDVSTDCVLEMKWEQQFNRRFATTNLSRTALAPNNMIADEVTRVWLSWLLEHVDELPEGFIGGRNVRGPSPLASYQWLEKYDGLTVFRLAANGWYDWLRSPKPIPEERILGWEAGHGSPLPVGGLHELYHNLLDLVLPLVSKLLMAEQGNFYLSAPTQDWQNVLKAYNGFTAKPANWSPYVEYIRGIEDLLYYEYPNCNQLNSKHRKRVDEIFTSDEIPIVIRCLRELASSRQERRVQMSDKMISTTRRIKKSLGDLYIGSIHNSWQIDSYKLG